MTSPFFTIQPFLDRLPGWPRFFSFFGRDADRCNQADQPLQGIGSILFLTFILLGFYNDNTLIGDPMIMQLQQPNFICGWHTGFYNIKSKMNCSRDFVYMLPTGALRANGRQVNV